MRDKYKKQVALLIRIMPSVYRIKEFAVHGGTAINLFHKNLPRYSVDTIFPFKIGLQVYVLSMKDCLKSRGTWKERYQALWLFPSRMYGNYFAR